MNEVGAGGTASRAGNQAGCWTASPFSGFQYRPESRSGAALDPGVADTLTRQAAESARKQEDLGHPACLLVPDPIRAPMARLLKRSAPRLKVLGHSEIPDTHSIRIGSIIGAAS